MTKKYTLEQIIERERERANEGGMFGITECKKSIEWTMKYEDKNLYQLLGEFVERANEDIFFNKTMVYACWKMINGEA